jgi:hypothetical protein
VRRAVRTCVAALRSVACALEEALALRRTLSFLQAVCQCRKADKTAEKSPLLPAWGGRGRQNVGYYLLTAFYLSEKYAEKQLEKKRKKSRQQGFGLETP